MRFWVTRVTCSHYGNDYVELDMVWHVSHIHSYTFSSPYIKVIDPFAVTSTWRSSLRLNQYSPRSSKPSSQVNSVNAPLPVEPGTHGLLCAVSIPGGWPRTQWYSEMYLEDEGRFA